MKRIISILILISVLFQAFYMNIGYADEFISETEKDKFVNDIRFLESIGVLNEDVRKNPEETLTRAELARILTCMDVNGILGLGETVFFEDVTDEDQLKYIRKAIDMGVMSATGENQFSPQRTVMTTEAICAVVRLVGYRYLADQKGGFPQGYTSVAESTKMLKGVNLNLNYPITYFSFINLILNAAEVDFFGKTYNSGESGYAIMKGHSIMSDWWELEVKEGQVTANNFTSLTDVSIAPHGFIGIDGVMYAVSDDFNDLLGYKIKYYIRKKDSRIVYIDNCGDKNTVLTISAEDIEDFQGRIYKYKKNNATKSVELETSPDVIYNGKAITTYTKADMLPKDGNVTLIDNDANGKYNLVLVKNYQTLVVYSVDTENKVFYDRFDIAGTVECSNLDDDNLYIFDEDGNRLKIADIRAWDVLSVAKSKDGKATKIFVSRKLIEGKAESYDADNNDIIIGGTNYKTISGYFDFANAGLGNYGTYYLNCDGKIAAFNNITQEQFGYLISGRIRRKEEKLELKIFDSNGKMQKLFCAEKVKIDGETVKDDAQTVETKLKKGETDIFPELIQYKMNNEGEISYIDTPYNNKINRSIDDDNDNAAYRTTATPTSYEKKDSLRLTYASNGKEFRYEQKTFAGRVFISDKTIFFSIPQTSVETAPDDDFGIVDMNYFKSGEYYRFDSYAKAEDPLNADVVILRGHGAKSRIGIISSVIKTYKDDEVVYAIELYSNHGKETMWADDLSIVENTPAQNTADTGTYVAGIGDIVSVVMNADQIVTDMKLMFDASSLGSPAAIKMASNPSSTSFSATNKLIYGSIYAKYNGAISVTTDTLPTDNSSVTLTYQEAYDASQFTIYKFLSDGKPKIIRASLGDLLDYVHCGQGYSKVAVLTDNVIPLLIIIYE